MKCLCIVGTRPEAIKVAPILMRMACVGSGFEPSLVTSGQHAALLDGIFEAFDIKPDIELESLSGARGLSVLAASLLRGLDTVIADIDPDVVLVQGDTTTAFCGALAAFHRRKAVAHVEAGLRTGYMDSPFPEEANRALVDRLATFLFAPTERNRVSLLGEGLPSSRIHVTGNTGIDALLHVRDRVSCGLVEGETAQSAVLAEVLRDPGPLALLTLHRREIHGERMLQILRTLRLIAEKNSDWRIIFPVHLNPNVRGAVAEILADATNFLLLEPLQYVEFVAVMDRSKMIITDSGGIQEEAPSLQKPVFVLRDHTERQEAIEAGLVRLIGTSSTGIEKALAPCFSTPELLDAWPTGPNPYGDGRASDRILDILRNAPELRDCR